MTSEDELFAEFGADAGMFYSALVRSTDNYIYIINMKTDVALVSPNMQKDFELEGRLVPGLVSVWGNLINPKDFKRYSRSIEAMLNGETDVHDVEYQVLNRKGEYVWVCCRGVLKRNDEGEPVIFAGVVTDLGSKGKIDYTTGLFTNRECEKEVGRIFENEENEEGGILLLGLDDFVRINDLNSHIFGDAVLRQFAQSVQQLLPSEAAMYRFDGDEFAIVYPGAGEEELRALYQKIHAYCNRPHKIDDSSYFLTVSVGVAIMGKDGSGYQELLTCALSALEVSKQNGKNTVTFFSQDMMHTRRRALELSSRLQLSVMNGMESFHLVYQPFVHSETLRVSGAEALLRWSCESYGVVSPVEFIPLLEACGLIVPVGKWVLEEAVRTCKKWLRYQPDFIMNVNISYLQMLDESFIDFVRQILNQYDLPPAHSVLELTESCFVTDMEALKEAFKLLRNLNIQIAMDDFGTGYSSLGMLSQSPADIVKIDRLFITAIGDEENEFNRSFIGSVIQLCHRVGISVCVEGVERKNELDTVCSLEADCIQGYYISKPLLQEDFEKKFWDV